MKELLLKLENGMRVCLLPNSEVGSVAVYLKGLAGSNYENLNNIGVAHLLEHLVLKGSQNYPAERDLLKLVTDGGGKFIGVTSRDDVLFGTHVLSEHIEDSLIFLSEIFYRPKLSEKDVPEVKSLLKTEINRCFDNPEKLVSRLAYATLFPNTRLARFNIGNIEDIDKITIAKVRNFYKKFYTNDRFVLVISGNFDVNNTKKLLSKYFNARTRESLQNKTIKITNRPMTKIYNQYKFSQDYIRIDFDGFKTSDNRKYSAQVLAKFLGATIKDISQKGGFAYKTDVTSYSTRQYGIFSFFAVCAPEKLNKVIDIFEAIVQKPVDKATFESSKKSIIANLLFTLEKPSMRAEYYSDLLLHGRVEQNHIYEINKINEVTSESLKKNLWSHPKITLISSKNREAKLQFLK